MTNRNDEFERYLDILFAEYRDTEPARRLRQRMLGQMLREKDRLREAGLSEQAATARTLHRFSQENARAEGSLLIYADRFTRDSAWSLLRWCLVGLVFSMPLLVLGRPLFPIIMLAATLLSALWAWQYLPRRSTEEVAFLTYNSTRKLTRILWIAFAVVWLGLTALALFPHSPAEPRLRIFDDAVKVARFYQPWLLLVFPLWGSGLKRVMLKNEVKH
ncbi:MAG: hypothetical protein IKD93_05650 [Firmicutes bacterium]|nr:hypothetical protein [Bacillota bacterium]